MSVMENKALFWGTLKYTKIYIMQEILIFFVVALKSIWLFIWS
jgi:hypothetical protein